MRKWIVAISCALMLTACSKSVEIDGKTVPPYGLFNPNAAVPGICYDISLGDAFISILFFETLIVPLISVGYHLYQPVGKCK